MASLELEQLQPKGMFQSIIHSLLCQHLKQYGVTVNGNEPGKVIKKFAKLSDPWLKGLKSKPKLKPISTHTDSFVVKDERFYGRLFMFMWGLDLPALGECYMDGWWTCDDLIGLIEKAGSKSPSEKRYRFLLAEVPKMMHRLSLLFSNGNTKIQSEKDISSHYDIGNDLYRLMLDRTMNYSCGYWQKCVPIGFADRSAEGLCESLEEAQMNKMLLIGRKLKLQPGMRVLDIGCGWGYLAKFLAVNFGILFWLFFSSLFNTRIN